MVSVRNISLNYHSPDGETPAIKNVSLEIEKGDFFSVVGPSGCGKSTLLSIISGLIEPESGEVVFTDKSSGRRPPLEPGFLGYMLQKDYLFEWRSIFSNITLGLEIQKKLNEENIAYARSLLKKYGLEEFENRKPSELSGGMRQRAALIRTLAMKPEVLLLDEPFSALDYQTRLSVGDEIGTIIREEHKTAIMVTHDISEAVSLSDKIAVLSRRPAVVKNVHAIHLTIEGDKERTPMKAREAPEFRHYFNTIWKELDVHEQLR